MADNEEIAEVEEVEEVEEEEAGPMSVLDALKEVSPLRTDFKAYLTLRMVLNVRALSFISRLSLAAL